MSGEGFDYSYQGEPGSKLKRDSEYLAKECAFDMVINSTDEILRMQYEMMKVFGFEEALIASEYFGEDALRRGKIPERKAMWSVAEELEMKPYQVQRKLGSVCSLYGRKTWY